ncbi:hypothetical protein PWT90_04579 [Aphanocladium album]|nr:hypothetical protein PWT90_04579 [Aphanocladium album]
MASEETPPLLLRFPTEILTAMCEFLPTGDIKNLRLAGPSIARLVPIRIHRVFLSPNPLNIAVFRAVAAHPLLRHRVREIIYDDARLADPTRRQDRLNDARRRDVDEELDHEDVDAWMGEGLQVAAREGAARAWFGSRRERNLREMRGRSANDLGSAARQQARADQCEAQLPLETCYQQYLRLWREQAQVVESGEDVRALREGLDAFPMLKRIAVTPATHGFLHTPLYKTPMVRALPYGFNGPLPRGWPTSREPPARELVPWAAGPEWTEDEVDREKMRWRGLVAVVRTLAERIRNGESAVPELVVDVHALNTGVSPYMLAQKCDEHDDLALILQQPGFTRLDLPVLLSGLQPEDQRMLGNGRFKTLLAMARSLQHFRLRGDGLVDPGFPPYTRFFPLQTLLPVNSWLHLCHFGLSTFVVRVDDLVAVLARLPRTLRSVELSFLRFELEADDHDALLTQIKAQTDWATTWPPGARPTLTLGLAKVTNNVDGRGLWLSKEISAFLYGRGPNPFSAHKNIVMPGAGYLRDEYDEDFTRPYVGYKDYRALWYNEED